MLAPARAKLAADLARWRGKPEQTLERIDRALAELEALERGRAGERDRELESVLAELHRVRGMLRLGLARQHNDGGLEREGSADLRRSREIFQELEKEAPWRFVAAMGLGNCAVAENRRIDALRSFEAASELDPLHHEPYLAKSRIYAAAGQNDQAIVELGQGLEKLPGEIHLELEKLGLELRFGEDCSARFQPFIARIAESEDLDLRAQLSSAALQQALILRHRRPDDPEEEARVSEHLELSVRLDEENANAWYFLAESQTRSRRFLAAIDSYDQALQRGTSYREESALELAKLVSIAYGKLLEGDRARAYRLMRHTLDMEGALAEHGYGLSGLRLRVQQCFEEVLGEAQAAMSGDRYDVALHAFKLARLLDKENAYVPSYLGMCLEELAQPSEARKVYEESIELALAQKLDVWWPFVALEDAWREGGDAKKAEAIARRYLDTFPEGVRASYFRERYP